MMLALICANMYYESYNEVIIIDVSNSAEFAFAYDMCALFNRNCSFNILSNTSIYLNNKNYSITAPISLGGGSRIIGRGNSSTLLVYDFPGIIIRESVRGTEISNLYIKYKKGSD